MRCAGRRLPAGIRHGRLYRARRHARIEGTGGSIVSTGAPPRPRVAYQGEHGANSEDAALTIFGDAETVPCPTLIVAFDALASGDADFATVPVENSQAGSINETYDLLLAHRDGMSIRGEFDLHVHHCLLALPEDDPATIRQALSHPQALA